MTDSHNTLIETERLVLRPLALEHLREFADLHADEEVTRYVSHFAELNTARIRLEQAEREWAEQGYGPMAVTLREDGRFIGRCGLRCWPEFGEVEAGWVLRRDAWGRGYATEAAGAVLQWAFANLDVPFITAYIMPANVRSVRVAQRLGMHVLERGRRLEQFDVDVDVYALSRG